MTAKRFTILYGLDEDPFDWDILDNEKDAIICQYNGTPICELLNELHEENEQLKKALLFFYDVANCECSTNWKGDMEKGCKRFFNCTYEEAKEKYGDYDGMWWEIND